MACLKITANSRKASTGANTLCFVKKTGSSKTMSSRSEAQVRLLFSSVSPTQQFFSGSDGMKLKGGQFLKREKSSIGDRRDRITQCGTDAVNLILGGWAELRLIGSPFIQVRNGSQHAPVCGCETMQSAKGAGLIIGSTRVSRCTSTTLSRLRLRTCEPILGTSFCFVSHVTTSSILAGI